MIFLLDLSIIIMELLAAYFLYTCYLPVQKRMGFLWIHSPVFLVKTAAVFLLYYIRTYMGDGLDYGTYYMLLNILTYLLLMYLFADLLFKGRRLVKLSLAVTTMVYTFFIEYFTYFVMERLLHINYFMEQGSVYYYCGCFGARLLAIAIVVVFRKGRETGGEGQKEKNIGIIQILLQISIPALTAVFLLLYPIFVIGQGIESDIYYFYVIIIFAFINIIHYIVIELYQKISAENYENKLMTSEYQLREEYYNHIEAYQEEIRMIKHDLKNQLTALTVTSDMVDFTKEVNEIAKGLEEKDQAVFTINQGIDMLLWAKQRYAKEHNIAVEFDIKVPEHMSFLPRDIHALVGNVMDNAIEACLKCSNHPFLKFKLLYHNHALFLKSVNSTDGKVNGLVTRKADPKNHGFGTRSIHAIVDKYFGNVEYELEEGIFTIELTLWEPKSQ